MCSGIEWCAGTQHTKSDMNELAKINEVKSCTNTFNNSSLVSGYSAGTITTGHCAERSKQHANVSMQDLAPIMTDKDKAQNRILDQPCHPQAFKYSTQNQ